MFSWLQSDFSPLGVSSLTLFLHTCLSCVLFQLYKTSHKTRRELRRAPRVSTFPHFHPADIFAPLPYPHFPPVPGIIGGEYDQRPGLPRGPLPRPRYDPIGPPADLDRRPIFRRLGPTGRRPADVRRGLI